MDSRPVVYSAMRPRQQTPSSPPRSVDTGTAIAQTVALISVLPSRQPGDIDADMLVAVYEMALQDLPGWAIMAAAKELARTQTFRPAPAELRQAALAEVRHESEMAKVRNKPEAMPANRQISAPPPTREETDRLNAHAASLGIATRFNYDGTTYQA